MSASLPADYRKKIKTQKLENALGELESALAEWDQLVDGGAGSDSAPVQTRSRDELPEDIKRETRQLLQHLRQQLAELSQTPSTQDKSGDDKKGQD